MDTEILKDALRGIIFEANNYHTAAECCGAQHVFNTIIYLANDALLNYEG